MRVRTPDSVHWNRRTAIPTGDGIEAAQSYADNNGLQLDTTLYIDRGVSALKGKNATEGALSAFLDAIDNGNVVIGSTLEIEHLDRLSRGHVLRALRLFSFFIEKRD